MDWFVSNVLFSRSKDTMESSTNNNKLSNSFGRSSEFMLPKQGFSCSQHEYLHQPVSIENQIEAMEIPPPYDTFKPNSPRPSHSTPSYRQQLVDKIRDTTSRLGYKDYSKPTVDRKSLSQGMKLVEIAVEEFESGNEAIALDVYLSGLDKIIMCLPSKFVYRDSR
jgi:hypothetical protein